MQLDGFCLHPLKVLQSEIATKLAATKTSLYIYHLFPLLTISRWKSDAHIKKAL